MIDSVQLSAAKADETRGYFVLVAAHSAELGDAFAPEVAQELGLSPSEFDARFPQVPGAIATYRPILDRNEAGVLFREERIEDFAQVKGLPLPAISWTAVLLGALLTAAAVPTLVRRGAGRHDRVDAEPAQHEIPQHAPR